MIVPCMVNASMNPLKAERESVYRDVGLKPEFKETVYLPDRSMHGVAVPLDYLEHLEFLVAQKPSFVRFNSMATRAGNDISCLALEFEEMKRKLAIIESKLDKLSAQQCNSVSWPMAASCAISILTPAALAMYLYTKK